MALAAFGFNSEKEWDYENGFYLTSHVTRLSKLLAHYELYKSIVDLPGDIVECGVYKGTSLVRFATFREILESPFSRKIIGFDVFGKFPEQQDSLDAAFAKRFEEDGGDGISVEELRRVFEYKSITNVELIAGNILSTIPSYVEQRPESKIALLHLDVDVYDASITVLRYLYERVVRGGVIILDDFGTAPGETRAIDEFFKDEDITINKLSLSHIPAFVRKP